MIKPVAKELMLDVQLLKNPKKIYKIQHCVELVNSCDENMTIEGCRSQLLRSYAVDIKNLKENIGIILQTLTNRCVIHINPAQQKISIVPEQLGKVLSDLRSKIKHSYDDVIGLVVGGRSFDSTNKFADKGVQLTDAICEFMENEHIPATKLLEQNIRGQEKGIDVYAHYGNVVLTNGIVNDFINANPKTSEQIQETGEKLFEIFEVSQQAPIRIVDEVLPSRNTNLKYY